MDSASENIRLLFTLQYSQADSSRRFHTSANDPPPPLPGVVDIPAVHVNRSVDTYKIERVMTGNSKYGVCIATTFFLTEQLFVVFYVIISKQKTVRLMFLWDSQSSYL